MNIVLSKEILLFFLVSALVSLFLLFKKDRPERLKFSISKSELKGFAISILALSILLALRIFFVTDEVWSNLILFAVSFTVPFLLRRLDLPNEALKVLLLSFVVLPVASNDLSAFASLSLLLGLLANKLLENLSFRLDNGFDDIVPACVWLTVLAWSGLTGHGAAQTENILLSCMSIALLLKCLPPSFTINDRFFIKRLAISASAGLVLLIILTKVLLLPTTTLLAVLYSVGLFFAYCFETKSSENDDMNTVLRSTTFLAVLGVLTLVATRLTGDIGLTVLSSTCVLCTGANVVIFAALFWLSRLLMQAFVSTYVANVTGINLMHSYCSAALYFGFLGILFSSLILHFGNKKLPVAMLLLGLLVPPAIIYLIHEEPTASFLIASNVAAISIFAFSPLMFKGENILRQGNIMLMPLMMSTMSLLYGPLVTVGNQATVVNRFQLVSYVAAAILVIYFVVAYLSKTMCKSISVSGNKS